MDGSPLLSAQEVLEADTMQVLGLPAAMMTFYGNPKHSTTGEANDGGEYARTAMRNLAMVSEPIDKRIVRMLLVHGDLTKEAVRGMGRITDRDYVLLVPNVVRRDEIGEFSVNNVHSYGELKL